MSKNNYLIRAYRLEDIIDTTVPGYEGVGIDKKGENYGNVR